MLSFLFILFIIFVAVPLARAAWAVHKMRTNAREAFMRAQQMQREEAERRRRDSRTEGWQSAPHRQKIYSRFDGEDVEWEEVAETTTTVDAADPRKKSSAGSFWSRIFRRTPDGSSTEQVVDVEWEDLP